MIIGCRFIFSDMQTSCTQPYCLFLLIFITAYCSGAADFQTFFILSNTGSGYSKRSINTLGGHFFEDFYYLKFLWKPVNVEMIEFPFLSFDLACIQSSFDRNIAANCIRHWPLFAIFQKLSLCKQQSGVCSTHLC